MLISLRCSILNFCSILYVFLARMCYLHLRIALDNVKKEKKKNKWRWRFHVILKYYYGQRYISVPSHNFISSSCMKNHIRWCIVHRVIIHIFHSHSSALHVLLQISIAFEWKCFYDLLTIHNLKIPVFNDFMFPIPKSD